LKMKKSFVDSENKPINGREREKSVWSCNCLEDKNASNSVCPSFFAYITNSRGGALNGLAHTPIFFSLFFYVTFP
jgi:hypothetical protein